MKSSIVVFEIVFIFTKISQNMVKYRRNFMCNRNKCPDNYVIRASVVSAAEIWSWNEQLHTLSVLQLNLADLSHPRVVFLQHFTKKFTKSKSD